ncbi:methionyl-tRNA formyltransferase [Alphaproteobacteria bacterium]|nr:methionyl-tRNA formyltransferase [Alphaproteobacteria bacterium]MDC1035182.1 methionyl-tRNA formyltransferase [Alphaproteobacteria bacterium]
MNIIFMGTPDFAVPSLKLLANNHNILCAFSQPARPNGRGMKIKDSPVEKAAKDLNIQTLTPSSLKNDDVFSNFKELNPDIVVVVAYGLILPEKYLKIPKFGCINGHASLLPRWRGAAPIQRAIEAGDKKTGSCIMLMEKGMDTGPVILSRSIDICQSDNAQRIHDKLSNITAEILIDAIKGYTIGNIEPVPQKEIGIKYANKIEKTEAEIDWEEGSKEIYNKIRAFDPFPGTFTFLHNNLIKIVSSRLGNNTHESEPGTIIEVGKKIIVACGKKTTLEIVSLQKPGKKIISTIEFLNGTKIMIGEKFGSRE